MSRETTLTFHNFKSSVFYAVQKRNVEMQKFLRLSLHVKWICGNKTTRVDSEIVCNEMAENRRAREGYNTLVI